MRRSAVWPNGTRARARWLSYASSAGSPRKKLLTFLVLRHAPSNATGMSRAPGSMENFQANLLQQTDPGLLQVGLSPQVNEIKKEMLWRTRLGLTHAAEISRDRRNRSVVMTKF